MRLIFSIVFFFMSLTVNADKINWPSKDLPKDPIQYFAQLKQQLGSSWEKNYGILATVDHEHQPQQRLMRIFSVTQEGIVFYTHAHTNKALEFRENPNISLLIFWRYGHEVIQTQVSGKVQLLGKGSSNFLKSKIDDDFNQYLIKPTSIKFTLSDSFAKNNRVTHKKILYFRNNGKWTASQKTYSIPRPK